MKTGTLATCGLVCYPKHYLVTIVIRECYFGWMRVRTGSVADLQVRLDFSNMSLIAPPTIWGTSLGGMAWRLHVVG